MKAVLPEAGRPELPAPGEEPTPVLLFGGRIRSLASEVGPEPEAILLKNGRVAALGARARLREELGPAGTEIDLQGMTAIPGLVDSHPHLMQHADQFGGMVDLSDAVDHDDIVARIARMARETPPGEWIMATPVGEPFYYIRRSYRDLLERTLPDRRVLDRATDQHPVAIRAWAPTTPNICSFNTLGLRTLGITDHIPERVCDVWIDKDGSGSVTGILRGSVNQIYSYDPYWTQLLSKLPAPTSDLLATTRKGMATYNARGVTTVFEPHNMWPHYVDAYEALHARGELRVRVMVAMEAESTARPPFQPATMEEFLTRLDEARARISTTDDWYRLTGISLSASGGPLGPGHMCMPEPYLDPYGRLTKGTEFVTTEKIAAFTRYCIEHDLRANFLGGGLGDQDSILAVLEADEFRDQVRGRGWIIEHAAIITEKHARRHHALGLSLTTSPGFSWAKGDLYGARVGEHVWRDLVPLKRNLRVGLPIACGSDWGPKNIFEQIQLSETFTFAGSGRANASPDHAVTRLEALQMWTSNAEQVLGWPGIGRLAPGSYADVAVLDRDPLTCSLDALPETQVLLTVAGGRIVHDAKAL